MLGFAPYILNGVIISLMVYLAGMQRHRLMSYLMLAVAIVFPCLLASFRGLSVGTDLSFYGYKIYYQAQANSFANYLSINPSFSIGFNVLTWTVANIVPKSLTCFLFVIQLCSCMPFVVSIYRAKGEFRWLGALIYALVIYPLTLNLIRQGIALGWCTLGYSILYEKSYDGKTILLSYLSTLIAFLFHSSALIGAAALTFQLALMRIPEKFAIILYRLSVFLIAIVFICYPFIIDLLASLLANYGKYITNNGDGMFGTSIMTCSFFVAFALFHFFIFRSRGEKNKIVSVQVVTIIVGSLLYLFAIYSEPLFRPSLYLLVISILIPSSLSSGLTEMPVKDKISYPLTISIWALGFYILYYCVFRLHEVVPYVFRLM